MQHGQTNPIRDVLRLASRAGRMQALWASVTLPSRSGHCRIDAAVTKAQQPLAIDGIEGVSLSGLASARGHLHAAKIKAEIGTRILAQVST